MNVYVSKNDSNLLDRLDSFEVVPILEDADCLILLPGTIGIFYDFIRGIKYDKDIFIYNEGTYKSSILPLIQEIPDEELLAHIFIEKDLDEIIVKLEEKKNEKLNNGKTRKLL